MASLILAILTIALLSAMAVTAINYTPWYLPRAQAAHEIAAQGVQRLEKAYELASAANTPADTPPDPTAASDGGLAQRFATYYGFKPAAPLATSWSYGKQSAAGTFQGANYFCLQGGAVNYAEYVGMLRLANTLGAQQAVIAGNCGATANSTLTAFPGPVALTYYVQYSAGVQ